MSQTASVNQQTLEMERGMDALKHALNSQHGFKNFMAQRRQAELAKQNQYQKSIEGLGAVQLNVDSEVYNFYCAKYGRQVWKDKTFLRIMREQHPEIFAQNVKGTRIQSGYGGLGSCGTRKRFTKTYPSNPPLTPPRMESETVGGGAC